MEGRIWLVIEKKKIIKKLIFNEVLNKIGNAASMEWVILSLVLVLAIILVYLHLRVIR